MGYSLTEMPFTVCVTTPSIISANTTLHGPVMRFSGEVVGVDVSSTSNHSGDNAANNTLVEVRCANRVAWSYRTNEVPLNNAAVSFPESGRGSQINSSFNQNEQLTVVFTRTGTPVNFPAGTSVWIHVSQVPMLQRRRTV